MLTLPSNPELQDFQDYVRKMEVERGFDSQSVLEKCLLLGEEVGELFKSIRKTQNMKVDETLATDKFQVEEELADVFIFLCSIANRHNIDLKAAFEKKEEMNKKRTWR